MKLVLLLLAAILLAGCAMHGARAPAQGLDLPPGHLPPPGQCRVWYPDRPPGQQPPPGPCHQLRHQVPYGAVLVRG